MARGWTEGTGSAQCRLTFERVEQYGVLTDVCKDFRVRRAIIMWDEINRVALGAK